MLGSSNYENFRYKGESANILEVIQNANVVVLPSFHEGFPRILIEAFACGRSVVTTTAPGCDEAVEDGFNGLKVPVGDSSSLALAIVRLLKNDDLRKQIGQRARLHGVKHFDTSVIVGAHVELFKTLIWLRVPSGE